MIIDLDVGGKLFRVSRVTLCTYPKSALGRMFDFDGPWEAHRATKEGPYFFDDDPEDFDKILYFYATNDLRYAVKKRLSA
jgi:hypothetical protein